MKRWFTLVLKELFDKAPWKYKRTPLQKSVRNDPARTPPQTEVGEGC